MNGVLGFSSVAKVFDWLAYQDGERSEEALPLFDQTLRLSRTVFGPKHIYTQICIAHLVQAYLEAGKAEEEMPVTKEELQRARVQLGFGHSQGQ